MNETMANQGNREAIHVDINNVQQVTGRTGTERISRTTWQPQSEHAEEAQRRLEAQIRQEWLQAQQREEPVVPLPEQVAQLRNLVRSLVTRIEVLEQGR